MKIHSIIMFLFVFFSATVYAQSKITVKLPDGITNYPHYEIKNALEKRGYQVGSVGATHEFDYNTASSIHHGMSGGKIREVIDCKLTISIKEIDTDAVTALAYAEKREKWGGYEIDGIGCMETFLKAIKKLPKAEVLY